MNGEQHETQPPSRHRNDGTKQAVSEALRLTVQDKEGSFCFTRPSSHRKGRQIKISNGMDAPPAD